MVYMGWGTVDNVLYKIKFTSKIECYCLQLSLFVHIMMYSFVALLMLKVGLELTINSVTVSYSLGNQLL